MMSLLFLKVDRENCNTVKHLMDDYCRASGQQVNLQKSGLFFSGNTKDNVKSDIVASFGVRMMASPGKYLGLLTIWGRSNTEALAFVKERIILKLQGWKIKFLSQLVGRFY